MRAKKWIMNNLGLKVLSLLLAIATWFYISWEFDKVKNEDEKVILSMLRYDVISKKLPIQLTVIGEVRQGYEFIADEITVEPEVCIVIGPNKILENVDSARTVPIDISEFTRDIDKQLALAPIARGITLKDEFVRVHIPIKKIENKIKEE